MVIVKDWKKYYTIQESIKISDEYIKKSALELANELKKVREKNINNENKAYV